MSLTSDIIALSWLEKLKSLYSEPHRAYHNLSHVEHMLNTLAQLKSDGKIEVIDEHAMELAIWFHDAIYDPTSPHSYNEKQSTGLLEEYHQSIKENPNKPTDASFNKAKQMILCTISHMLPVFPPTYDGDFRVFLDLDLSILGSPRGYDVYSDGIRKEYGHFDDDAYRKGRIGVLNKFLQRDVLYFSTAGRELWEENARKNMERETGELERGGS